MTVFARLVARRLQAIGAEVHRLGLGQGFYLLATDLGGRVYGPFQRGRDAFGWVPDDLATCGWNLGGTRLWIAPERHFHYTDTARMLDTYRVDPALEPARWHVAADKESLTLTARLDLPLSDRPGRAGVFARRQITPLSASDLPDGAAAGYRQVVRVEQTDGPTLPLVPWLLTQLAPGATACLQARPGARAATVFGTPPQAAVQSQGSLWRIPFRGQGLYKIACHAGDIGQGQVTCLRGAAADGMVRALLFRPVLASPQSYPESLPQDPAATGQAVSIFYDSGTFGRYAEVEFYGHRTEAGAGVLVLETAVLRAPMSRLADVPETL